MNTSNNSKSPISNGLIAKMSKENYKVWKDNSLENAGYFVIFNGFLEQKMLKKISGNALKLYVFLGIKSDNYTGESFFSIQSIAKYFGKSERTISNWIAELEELKLIKRVQLKHNEVSHTFLQPYFSGRVRETENGL